MDLHKNDMNEEFESTREIGGMKKRAAVLAGLGILTAALLICGVSLTKGCGAKKTETSADTQVSMQEVFENYLEEQMKASLSGVSDLKEEDQDSIVAVAVDTLERLIGDGNGRYNKAELVAELEKAINDLNLGLSAETVTEMAAKFVELYTQSYFEVYNDTERTNLTVKQMGDSILNEMRENLTSISEYLSQLDTEIVNNQTTLEEVINSNGELGSQIDQNTLEIRAIREQVANELTTISTRYGNLYNKFDSYEKQFASYLENYVASTQAAHTGIVSLQQSVSEVKENLTETRNTIINMLEELEGKENQTQDQLNQQIQSVKNHISETNTLIQNAEKNVQTTLEEMEAASDEKHEEMLDTLAKMEYDLGQMLEEEMTALDESISSMNESLSNQIADSATEMKEQMQSALTDVQQEFANVNNRLNSSEEKFAEFCETYKADVEESGIKLDNIQTSITEAKAQLSAAKQELADTLTQMESNDVLRQEELNQKLDSVQKSVEAVQTQITEIGGSIQDTLADMKAENQAEHAQIIAALEELEQDILTAAEESTLAIRQDITNLQGVVESESAEIQNNLDSSVTGLKDQMSDIHGQIASTQEEIAALLQSMDEKQDVQYEDIMQAIEDAVDDIDDSVDTAYNNLQALIRIFNADMTENHRDTLDTLENMEESMAEAMTDNLSQINDSFGNLNTTLDAYFKEMQESQNAAQDALDTVVEELGTDLTENQQIILDKLAEHDKNNNAGQEYIKQSIEQHNSDMHLESAEIKGEIEDHNTGILSALEGFVNTIEQKLDSVFTFVSNGKKLLASALLTKSVSVNEDATFQEFADAILAIPQEIVIGVQQIPGEISYDYHYHTDANGNALHEDTNDVSGGCYTVPVYHQHSSACYSKTTCGGGVSYKTSSTHWKCSDTLYCDAHGCYWEDPSELYPSGCWHCYCPEETYTVCNSCGATNSGSPCKASTTKLTCGKNGSTIEGYAVGCGLSDGQIIGAHIVYNSNAVSAAAVNVMSLEAPVEEEIIQNKVETYPQIVLPEGAVIDRGDMGAAESEDVDAAETESTEIENVETEETMESETVEESAPEESESEMTESSEEEADPAESEQAGADELPEESEVESESETSITEEDVEEKVQTETEESASTEETVVMTEQEDTAESQETVIEE